MLPLGRFPTLGDGVELHVRCGMRGGGTKRSGNDNKGRKRGAKGAARRAGLYMETKRQTLLYSKIQEIMEARSRPNEEVSFREYEEEMEDQLRYLSKEQKAGLIAEEEYAKKLKRLKVPIYGNLRINSKANDSIRLMSLNINGLSMSKRGNSKAERLKLLISKYQLDAVGIQEVCVNWDEYKSSNRLAALLRRGYDPIRSVQSYNTLEGNTNIGNVQRGGTATVLQGLFSKFVKKTGKSTGVDHTGLGQWSWYTMEGEHGVRTR